MLKLKRKREVTSTSTEELEQELHDLTQRATVIGTELVKRATADIGKTA